MARLDNNLHALQRHHSSLFEALRDTTPSDRLTVVESRKGPVTAEVRTPEGPVLLHSRFDPEREAGRFAESQNLRGAVIIIYGFGCGYHVEAVLEAASPVSRIVVVDPDIAQFRSVLEHRDLTRLFASDRLRLLVGVPPHQIQNALQDLLIQIFLGTRILVHEPSRRAAPTGLYRDTSQAIRDFIDMGTTSLYTAASISAQSRFNTFMNMPHLLYNPGVEMLRDAAKGCAAVVIGAGPSLQKNIDLLREAPVVRIATGTILKKLIAMDLTPHFVCNIDYHFKLTKKYFQDLPPLPDTILVTDPRANYGAADAYPGPVCAWEDPVIRILVGELWDEPHGALQPAATVAQACFHLAQHLGCDPIMLIGMDLAYPGHMTHMPGTAILDDWLPETNRFHSMEDKEWDYIARTRSTLFQVPDMNGVPVYTDRQMFTYIQVFNQLFQECPQRVIDASEQGARKHGADTMPFAEALKETFRPLPEDFDPAGAASWSDTGDRDRVLEHFRVLGNNTATLIGLYEEMIAQLETLSGLVEDAGAFARGVRDLEEIRRRLTPFKEYTEVVNELGQADDYQRQREDLMIRLDAPEGAELRARQVECDINFSRGLLGGARYLEEFIRQARRRLEAWPETRPEGILDELEMIQDKILRTHG